MNQKDNSTPVVIIGLYTSGLSLARSLGQQGIKVIGVSKMRLPATYSRFVTYVKEPETEDENERLDFYVNLGKKIELRAPILAVNDYDVMFLSRNRGELEKHFLFIFPSHDLLKSLTSKLDFISLADKHNIPVPASIPIKNQSDLENIPSEFFPCVIKPESPQSWLTGKAYRLGFFGLKTIPVKNKTELLALYDRAKDIGSRLTVQEMIYGPDENNLTYHALIGPNGQTIAEFVGRKLRLSPPHFGMGCYVESIESDEVINEGRRILRLLNYIGQAEIDFKRDERDGQLYFLELNPRFGLWIGLDVACGVNFPYYYYKLCLGQNIAVSDEYNLGKKWLCLQDDIKGLKTILNDGTITWHKWILSIIKANVGAVYSHNDPLPALILILDIFKKLIINKSRRLTGYRKQG